MSNKYKAKRHTYDDHVFASGRELGRYKELLLLQQAGKISGLECQPGYELIPKQIKSDGKAERVAGYKADFRYFDKEGCLVVEDVKSKVTAKLADYVLRRKLMLHVHGIEIREIL